MFRTKRRNEAKLKKKNINQISLAKTQNCLQAWIETFLLSVEVNTDFYIFPQKPFF